MKTTLFHLSIVLTGALLTFGAAFAEDGRLQSGFSHQGISEKGSSMPIERKDTNVAVSIHHSGSTTYSKNYFLPLDLARLRREVEMDIFFQNAYENPTSPNILIVFKMVLDEFTILKGLKRFLERLETEVENYRQKYKLKGEVDFAEPFYIDLSNSTSPYSEKTMRSMLESENSFPNLMPKKISWHFSSDLGSNYLKGEIKLGNHFYVEGNWGSDSDVKAMFTLPF